MAHTWLTLMKMFTNLKVNQKRPGLYIGAKMQLVSHEFKYLSSISASGFFGV